MRRTAFVLFGLLFGATAAAEPTVVTVSEDEQGYRLLVDGEPTMVVGMNWSYIPVGENYTYILWDQPDDFIEEVLRREMALLQDMGVNALRLYPGIPPKWVTWIYENYGIYTMINPLLGRYGVNVDGTWVGNTNYADPRTREVIIAESVEVARTYSEVPGILMILLGNENNYGLSWSSFEIEALPKGERDRERAKHLYSLWGETVDAIHQVDPHHPVAICNGDLQYLDLVKTEVPNLDIMGSNVYRGISSRDLFDRVEDELGVPFLYMEFGADAYDARLMREDQVTQARYLHGQWQEIYEHSWGKGRAGNAIGGFIFQWTDGWWKYQQEINLDVHDNTASWPNDAYREDFVEGRNNMNEEWFGITAKTPPDPQGHYDVQPRVAYYLLRDVFHLDPYDPDTDLDLIRGYFDVIEPTDYVGQALAVRTAAELKERRAHVANLRLDLETTTSGGSEAEGRGALNGSFDHLQSAYLELTSQPVDSFRSFLSVNVLGNVPENRIDRIFFENRGARTEPELGEEEPPLDRVKLYQGEVTWTRPGFELEAYYRTGHYHWAYEGDFFGLYREANYGPNIDIYNADAPIGIEFRGKQTLDGLKIAFGPQVFWGANPTLIAKYSRPAGPFTWTVMHQEDIAPASAAASTVAISEQMIRRTTMHVEWKRNALQADAGAIWAGSNKVGQAFEYVQEAKADTSYNNSGYDVLTDEVKWADTLGGKVKLTWDAGRFGWYGQTSYKGLVADGGPDAALTLTGWTLKESGRGNQISALTGARVGFGNVQIAPNLLFQQPLVGPNPSVGDSYDPDSRYYFPGVRPRNVQDDPFAVLDNRETYGGEVLLSYDPTPGTWMWMWDNDVREDANFAGSIDFAYRHQPTVRDANFGFTEDGILFAFDGSPPAADEWTLSTRLVFNTGPVHLITRAYTGQAQSTGIDERLIWRWGGDLRLWWRSLLWQGMVKVDDWGPYDFHRDYNQTFPLQVNTDVSGGLGRPRFIGTNTRLGALFKLRYLDENSPDVTTLDGSWGNQWEVGTYLRVSL